MKEYISAKAIKVEEKKDSNAGATSYRVVLEIVDTLTVNSAIKPEVGKEQLFEVSRYDFTDEKGKQIKGFKIIGSLK